MNLTGPPSGSNEAGFHVPEPLTRPGEEADFSHLAIPAAGLVARPAFDADPAAMRDHAFQLIRVEPEPCPRNADCGAERYGHHARL